MLSTVYHLRRGSCTGLLLLLRLLLLSYSSLSFLYVYCNMYSCAFRNADKLPGVDIFVCTADPTIEPPTLVVNTVFSATAYNYPTEKLSVYISDDWCSELTFYALLEASHFSKHWIPFCKKFKVEPRSPEASPGILIQRTSFLSKNGQLLR